jgi:hypothetical protein
MTLADQCVKRVCSLEHRKARGDRTNASVPAVSACQGDGRGPQLACRRNKPMATRFGIWSEHRNGTSGTWVKDAETRRRAEYTTLAEAKAVAQAMQADEKDHRYSALALDDRTEHA